MLEHPPHRPQAHEALMQRPVVNQHAYWMCMCVWGGLHHISHFLTPVSRRLSAKRVWWGKKRESVIERTKGGIGGTRGEKGNSRKKERRDSGGAWERWREMTEAAWNIPLMNAKHCGEQQKHTFWSGVRRGQRVNKYMFNLEPLYTVKADIGNVYKTKSVCGMLN